MISEVTFLGGLEAAIIEEQDVSGKVGNGQLDSDWREP